MYLFWFRECAWVKNNSRAATRIVIKFHAASVPLGRGPLIQLKGFFFFFFLPNKPHPVTSGVFFLCIPLLPRTVCASMPSVHYFFPDSSNVYIYLFHLSFHPWSVQLPFSRCCYDCRVNKSCAALTAKDAPMMRPTIAAVCALNSQWRGRGANWRKHPCGLHRCIALTPQARSWPRWSHKKIILKHINFARTKGATVDFLPLPSDLKLVAIHL